MNPTKSASLTAVALALVISASANAATLTEDFEAAFPAWKTGWLGANSNLSSFYIDAGSGNIRGNTPDGLWVADGDGYPDGSDATVDIAFNNAFGQALTSFQIDVAAILPGGSIPFSAGFQIYDTAGNILLNVPSIALTNGWALDPGTYVTYGATSTQGIGGFRFLKTSFFGIEGNVAIDNVIVNGAVPLPMSAWLFGSGLAGLAALGRRREAKAQTRYPFTG